MPVRKILKGTQSVTGYFPSIKNNRMMSFESPIEMEYFYTLEFDDDVESFEEQPLRIENQENKNKGPYFPDCIVYYKSKLNKRPLLIEVKSSIDLEKKEKLEKFQLKFRTLEKYAMDNNLDFKIVTEKEIRGVYLDNIKFLYSYRKDPQEHFQYEKDIIKVLKTNMKLTVSQLLNNITDDKNSQGVLIKSVWNLIFKKIIITDLEKPLSNDSILELRYG